ncbi:MAG: WYL domain-containing protein [Saccharospirillaceae bacterium]|nr:WYL domain-containing protein [Pseudomonadales bacterium]NRB78704.1 WYL domain-containing protein [Saccharospirillaceae bacterium]
MSSDEIFKVIELLLYWEGECRPNDIGTIIPLGDTTIKKHFRQYRELNPNQCYYDDKLKTHCISDNFESTKINQEFSEYQSLLSREDRYSDLNLLFTPIRNITSPVIRDINKAIRNKTAINIKYQSMSSEGTRLIQPHTIINDGLRCHVRAFCHKRKMFLDFVISRIVKIMSIELIPRQDNQALQDILWNTNIDIVIIPDPRLTTHQQKTIELDYAMTLGKKTIQTRAALVQYVVKRLRVDLPLHPLPQDQQIVLDLESSKRIIQYLP